MPATAARGVADVARVAEDAHVADDARVVNVAVVADVADDALDAGDVAVAVAAAADDVHRAGDWPCPYRERGTLSNCHLPLRPLLPCNGWFDKRNDHVWTTTVLSGRAAVPSPNGDN